MKAEIIAIGSEMLTPDHLDTNSLFLTRRLNENGIEVHLKTVVGDSKEDIARIFRQALERSEIIVFSGGLGPTEDDLTRPAVAEVLKRPVSVDPDIAEALRRRFAARGYSMPLINERQAEVIEGAEMLRNPYGTAPGMLLAEKGSRIALLPGPPRELEAMFDREVLPRLFPEPDKIRTLARREFRITGMTESEVDTRVAPIYKAYPFVQTTILASIGHISLLFLRWLAPGESPVDLNELAEKVRLALGDAIFTTSGESLEVVAGRLLLESGRTISVAESCTAGMIGARITRVPGSSDYFLGGILCYSNEAKIKLCGVPAEVLERHGAVSAETAEALAAGVRDRLNSSIGLSVTGIAGPGGGSEGKPVGLVFVGLSDGKRTAHWRRILPGDRESIRGRASYYALSLLRRFLNEKKTGT